jgi:hypothetical protein
MWTGACLLRNKSRPPNTSIDPATAAHQVMRLGQYLDQRCSDSDGLGRRRTSLVHCLDRHGHGTNVDLGCIAESDALRLSDPSFSTGAVHT